MAGPRIRVHVVIAEDDLDLRAVVRTFLLRAGFRVTCVGDGASLVREVLASHSDPDRRAHLVITDMDMPALPGLSAIEELRERGVRLPFIAVTGSGNRDELSRALEMGAVGVFEKPIPFRDLIAVVRSIES